MDVPRVRYLTIPRSSFEIVTALTDAEKAHFVNTVYDCFVQLENGEEPVFKPTDSKILNMAIRDSVLEVESGFQTYMKRMTARKNHKETIDESMTDHRSIIDLQQKEENRLEKKEGNRLEKKEENRILSVNHQVIDEAQRQEIEIRLQELGIEADDGFWNTARKYGYDMVDDALSKAESVGITSLKCITGMIKEGV